MMMVGSYQHFRRACCYHHQGWSKDKDSWFPHNVSKYVTVTRSWPGGLELLNYDRFCCNVCQCCLCIHCTDCLKWIHRGKTVFVRLVWPSACFILKGFRLNLQFFINTITCWMNFNSGLYWPSINVTPTLHATQIIWLCFSQKWFITQTVARNHRSHCSL
jgi:hypothetical protein